MYVCVCRNNPCTHPTSTSTPPLKNNKLYRGIVTREYFAGANLMGPYLLARFLGLLPLSYGPFILALLVYWMTGQSACVYVHVCVCMYACTCVYVAPQPPPPLFTSLCLPTYLAIQPTHQG